MTLADWLLAAGSIPAAYVAYWMAKGVIGMGTHGRSATVNLHVGGPYILLVLILIVAGLVGVALTVAS